MELNLKYNATKIDEIEQARKLPIENCVSDASISMLSLFIQKGLIDDNGVHGVSKSVAMNVIDEYLKTGEKDDLLLDITEALIKDGFLSRRLDVEKIRAMKNKRLTEAQEKMEDL